MKKLLYLCASLSLTINFVNDSPALAKWGKFTITDDNGEQVVVKHGLFGKKTIVKDRWGDGFEHKRSIFGLTKDTQVSAVGNDVHVHKGLFGFGKTEGQDMLGDTISSHNNPLYHNTNVNLSGVNNVIDKYFGSKKPLNSPLNPNFTKQNPHDPVQNFSPPIDPNIPQTTPTQNF
jgi:hypothetical protein